MNLLFLFSFMTPSLHPCFLPHFFHPLYSFKMFFLLICPVFCLSSFPSRDTLFPTPCFFFNLISWCLFFLLCFFTPAVSFHVFWSILCYILNAFLFFHLPSYINKNTFPFPYILSSSLRFRYSSTFILIWVSVHLSTSVAMNSQLTSLLCVYTK